MKRKYLPTRRGVLRLLGVAAGAGLGTTPALAGTDKEDPGSADGNRDIRIDNGVYDVTIGELDSDQWLFDITGNGTPSTGTLFSEFFALGADGTVLNSSEDGAVLTAFPNSGVPGVAYTSTVDLRVRPFSGGGVIVFGQNYTPLDPDGDGLYEDVNGDGTVDRRDQSALDDILSSHERAKAAGLDPGEDDGRVQRLTDAQLQAFDFTGNGSFDGRDVVELGRQIARGTALGGGSPALDLEVDRSVSVAGGGTDINADGAFPDAFFSIEYEITNAGTDDIGDLRLFQYCDYDIVGSQGDSGAWVSSTTPDYVYQNDVVTDQYSASWYDSDWAYRKEITIDHTQVETTLTDFPVWVHFENDGDLGAHAQNNADDLLFTAADGTTKLDHEIEYVGALPGGGGLTVDAHVKVPSVSDSQDTTIYAYFGNPSAANQENVAGVWSNGFSHVYHLSENADDSAGSNNGTVSGAVEAPGQIYDGYDFDGTDDRIELADDSYTNVTISAWANPDTLSTISDSRCIVGLGSDSTVGRTEAVLRLQDSTGDGTADTFQIRSFDGSVHSASAGTPAADTWQYVAGVYDENAQEYRVNFNGGAATGVSSDSSGVSDTDNTAQYGIGANFQAGSSSWTRPFDGTIDEVRISSVARPDEWLNTTYNNQVDPASFYTMSGRQVREVYTGFSGQSDSTNHDVDVYNTVEPRVKSGNLSNNSSVVDDDAVVALEWDLGGLNSGNTTAFTVFFGAAGDQTTLEELVTSNVTIV